MPAPFSRVLKGPPAHPAINSVPAKKSIGALAIRLLLVFIVIPFFLVSIRLYSSITLNYLFCFWSLGFCLPLGCFVIAWSLRSSARTQPRSGSADHWALVLALPLLLILELA
jgi:hypothetical protein